MMIAREIVRPEPGGELGLEGSGLGRCSHDHSSSRPIDLMPGPGAAINHMISDSRLPRHQRQAFSLHL